MDPTGRVERCANISNVEQDVLQEADAKIRLP